MMETSYFIIIHSQSLSEVFHFYRLAKISSTKSESCDFNSNYFQYNISPEDLVLFQQKLSQSLLSNAEKIFSGAVFKKAIHHKTD
ncbi:hypothetical protein [Chryseobacterium paludis]|uniref:hypothetical protein n=1 Tax=Chryseobacterium paludis TaxID=2956784 RepID=UPI0021BEFD3C|nr:hypothetical protein [Chryseobacterium paludis]